MKTLFKKMVYASTEEECYSARNTLKDLNGDTTELDIAKHYFEINWHLQRDLFAFYIQKNKSIFDCFTNNRSENYNRQLKQKIPKQPKFLFVVKEAIHLQEEQALRATQTTWNERNKT